jgi:hypothetical protein
MASKPRPRPSAKPSTPESLGAAKVRRLFLKSGLPTPPFPKELVSQVRELEDWHFATHDFKLSPYNFDQFVDRARRGRLPNSLIVAHAGHGVNSYAIHYYVVRKPLYLFLQIGWGGAYMDNKASATAMSRCFEAAARLIEATERAVVGEQLAPTDRVVVGGTSFYRGSFEASWSGSQVPLVECAEPEDALERALEWLRQLRLGSKLAEHPRILERLQSEPSKYSVRGSLPVLFFGNLFNASVATIGLNPSRQEYCDREGRELDARRRFETLKSLQMKNRGAVTGELASRAIGRMTDYFLEGKPVYPWFNGLKRVLDGLGASFSAGSAVHLDLVQEATNPLWSALRRQDPIEADRLLATDLPFLKWQLETFPISLVVCTSARVLKEVSILLRAETVERGKFKGRDWEILSGRAGGRPVAVAGWNIPLGQAPGLRRGDQTRLGALLRARLEQRGLWLAEASTGLTSG